MHLSVLNFNGQSSFHLNDVSKSDCQLKLDSYEVIFDIILVSSVIVQLSGIPKYLWQIINAKIK